VRQHTKYPARRSERKTRVISPDRMAAARFESWFFDPCVVLCGRGAKWGRVDV
jgi:hypothetical protein